MTGHQVLYGFHAVSVRLRIAPQSVRKLYLDTARRDARMRRLVARAAELGVPVQEAGRRQLEQLSGGTGHQGVVALADPLQQVHSLEQVLQRAENPLLLVLDGVTDPRNLGACLRVADGAGAHAVIAPRDRAVGLGPTVSKVASGAAESVPYLMVTNLARTLVQLKEQGVWIVGTSDAAADTIYAMDLTGPIALVLGAEGHGLRELTRRHCDFLASIPMLGAVESLNVSVASGICLYEAQRQRRPAAG